MLWFLCWRRQDGRLEVVSAVKYSSAAFNFRAFGERGRNKGGSNAQNPDSGSCLDVFCRHRMQQVRRNHAFDSRIRCVNRGQPGRRGQHGGKPRRFRHGSQPRDGGEPRCFARRILNVNYPVSPSRSSSWRAVGRLLQFASAPLLGIACVTPRRLWRRQKYPSDGLRRDRGATSCNG